MAGNWFSDFFSGPSIQDYNDPYRGQIDSTISELNSGNLGKQFAANTTGIIRRQAQDNLRQIGNSGIGRNAAALSRVSDKTLTQADQDITGAQLKGAEYDTGNKLRAAGLMEQNRQFDYNDFERKDEQRRQPSPFESLLNTAVGTVAGGLTGGLAGGLGKKIYDGITSSVGGDQNNDGLRAARAGIDDFKGYISPGNRLPATDFFNTDVPQPRGWDDSQYTPDYFRSLLSH